MQIVLVFYIPSDIHLCGSFSKDDYALWGPSVLPEYLFDKFVGDVTLLVKPHVMCVRLRSPVLEKARPVPHTEDGMGVSEGGLLVITDAVK